MFGRGKPLLENNIADRDKPFPIERLDKAKAFLNNQCWWIFLELTQDRRSPLAQRFSASTGGNDVTWCKFLDL
jgi:hypothetical protein